jgi:hypothetical protein
MDLPPNLLVATALANVTNGFGFTAVVAAPGGGLRLRVWMALLRGSSQNPAGALEAYVRAGVNGAGPVLGETVWAATGAAPPIYWPGGIALTANTRCEIQHVASAVGPFGAGFVVGYTLEAG